MSPTQTTPSNDSANNFASQILGRLKQDILTGYFAPGEKLRMSRLKERYQVGVSPLREALSQLLVEQLVVVENQRGFKVHPISLAEMRDIYETRAHIESLCVSQAIAKGDDQWEANILAASHRLKKSAELIEQGAEQRQQWEARHQDFHRAIAGGCNSPALLHVRRSLYEKASRYRNLWLKQNMVDEAIFDTNQKEHDQLVEALLARDNERATALVQQHLLSPSQALEGNLPLSDQ